MSNLRYQPISTEGIDAGEDGINNNGSSSLGVGRRDNDDDDEPIDNDYDVVHIRNNNNSKLDSNQCKIVGSFWVLGLLNNSSYVIMLASAKSISEGGTGLVFVTTVTPSLLIKFTAPYWFDRVPYNVRLGTASICMVIAFTVVGSCTALYWRLLGVAFISVAGGLGEPCLLALAGRFDGAAAATAGRGNAVSRSEDVRQPSLSVGTPPRQQQQQQQQQQKEKETGRCLTAFASGTGFAGVFGFFWKWFWNDWLGFSMSTTLWLAVCIPFGYWNTFRYVMTYDGTENNPQQQYVLLPLPEQPVVSSVTSLTLESSEEAYIGNLQLERDRPTTTTTLSDGKCMAKLRARTSVQGEIASLSTSFDDENDGSNDDDNNEDRPRGGAISRLTSLQRFHLVLSLWPYTIPLFVVYATEYMLQSGTWTSIGFPVTNVESRKQFYQYSNWLYQAGVFVSRSSGTLFTVPMAVLWLMPTLQALNVVIYWSIAANQQDSTDVDSSSSFWHSPTFLYSAAFYTGILGGAVYIHGYKRICRDVSIHHREFALSATSVAESFGILMADLSGLVIQACLYRINKLDGAVVTCPFKE